MKTCFQFVFMPNKKGILTIKWYSPCVKSPTNTHQNNCLDPSKLSGHALTYDIPQCLYLPCFFLDSIFIIINYFNALRNGFYHGIFICMYHCSLLIFAPRPFHTSVKRI